MMLKSVDLPQPDGPMTARNSPGATVNDMRSIATTGPPGVSKCLETSSTTRMASVGRSVSATRAGAGVMRLPHHDLGVIAREGGQSSNHRRTVTEYWIAR